jgi:hypothetical protein
MKKIIQNINISSKNVSTFLTVLGVGTVSYFLYKTFTSNV